MDLRHVGVGDILVGMNRKKSQSYQVAKVNESTLVCHCGTTFNRFTGVMFAERYNIKQVHSRKMTLKEACEAPDFRWTFKALTKLEPFNQCQSVATLLKGADLQQCIWHIKHIQFDRVAIATSVYDGSRELNALFWIDKANLSKIKIKLHEVD